MAAAVDMFTQEEQALQVLLGWLLPSSTFLLIKVPAYWMMPLTFRVGFSPQLLSHMSIISGNTLMDTLTL
jgi:hypothetical protein